LGQKWTAFIINKGMDFGRTATTADAYRLILLPPFAPLAARCASTIVLSIRCKLFLDLAASVLKIFSQMPRFAQRLNLL
jgi:hypothetical protein